MRKRQWDEALTNCCRGQWDEALTNCCRGQWDEALTVVGERKGICNCFGMDREQGAVGGMENVLQQNTKC